MAESTNDMEYGELRPGLTIADRYELERLLGEGGMGQVWKARHMRLDAPVAMKFLHADASDRGQFKDRFEREAQLAASIKHRNVVTITDYGETSDGVAYMVMDYLEGEPFANYVRGAFPTEEVVHIVSLALRGLAAVHAAGIVHRDLKPDNIFLVRDGSGVYPKLLDFGISRQTDQSQSKRSAVTTQQGLLLGTPAYMSPEQARGLRDIDARTDIYSMGVLLYESLSGQLPFNAEHVGDLMVQIISGHPRPLHELCPELPSALCDAVMKAIERDRDVRFQSAEAMRQALTLSITGTTAMTPSERPPSAMGFVAVPRADDLASQEPVPFAGSKAQTLSPQEMAQPVPWTSQVRAAPGVRRRWTGVVAAAFVVVVVAVWFVVRQSDSVTVTDLPVPVTPVVPEASAPVPGVVTDTTPAVAPTRVVEPEPSAAATEPAVVVPDPVDDTAVTKRKRVNKARPAHPAKSSGSKVLTELDY